MLEEFQKRSRIRNAIVNYLFPERSIQNEINIWCNWTHQQMIVWISKLIGNIGFCLGDDTCEDKFR